jgi:hypothetical protein
MLNRRGEFRGLKKFRSVPKSIWGRRKVCTGCWWGIRRKSDHWGDPDVDGRIILSWIFRKLAGVVGAGWSWLRIGTGGGHL